MCFLSDAESGLRRLAIELKELSRVEFDVILEMLSADCSWRPPALAGGRRPTTICFVPFMSEKLYADT